MICAFRFDRTSEGPKRIVYSFVYNLSSARSSAIAIKDVNFSFKVVHRRVLEAVELKSQGSFIDAELVTKAIKRGFRVFQMGVDYFPRTRGVTTLASPQVIVKMVKELADLYAETKNPAPPSEACPDAGAGDRASDLAAEGRLSHLSMATTRLVVNADDLGLHPEIDRGILRAHAEGIVTSSTVLVTGPSAAAAVTAARAQGLALGVHLCLSTRLPPAAPAAAGRLAARRRALPRQLGGARPGVRARRGEARAGGDRAARPGRAAARPRGRAGSPRRPPAPPPAPGRRRRGRGARARGVAPGPLAARAPPPRLARAPGPGAQERPALRPLLLSGVAAGPPGAGDRAVRGRRARRGDGCSGCSTRCPRGRGSSGCHPGRERGAGPRGPDLDLWLGARAGGASPRRG